MSTSLVDASVAGALRDAIKKVLDQSFLSYQKIRDQMLRDGTLEDVPEFARLKAVLVQLASDPTSGIERDGEKFLFRLTQPATAEKVPVEKPAEVKPAETPPPKKEEAKVPPTPPIPPVEKKAEEKPVVTPADLRQRPAPEEKKPQWLRGTRLRQDIFELQGSYGFPRDKMVRPAELDQMTYEAGEKWFEEATKLKESNLKEMDDKLEQRISKALGEILPGVMKELEERVAALATRIKALEASPAPPVAPTPVSTAPARSRREVTGADWMKRAVISVLVATFVVAILLRERIGHSIATTPVASSSQSKVNESVKKGSDKKSSLRRALEEYDDNKNKESAQ